MHVTSLTSQIPFPKRRSLGIVCEFVSCLFRSNRRKLFFIFDLLVHLYISCLFPLQIGVIFPIIDGEKLCFCTFLVFICCVKCRYRFEVTVLVYIIIMQALQCIMHNMQASPAYVCSAILNYFSRTVSNFCLHFLSFSLFCESHKSKFSPNVI